MANLTRSVLRHWKLVLLSTVAAVGCSSRIEIAQGDAGAGTGGIRATGGAYPVNTGGSPIWGTGGAYPTGGRYIFPTGGAMPTGGAPNPTGGAVSTGGVACWTPIVPTPNGHTCICALANALTQAYQSGICINSNAASCSSNSPNDCTLQKAYCGQTCAGQAISCSTDCVAGFADHGFSDSTTYTSGSCTVTINCM
jgi:hypothetical protein